MNKRIDMSVLPDDFLVDMQQGACGIWMMVRFSQVEGYPNVTGIRPTLNHWHFNQGDLVLPDGLVVEADLRYAGKPKGYTSNNEIYFFESIGDVESIYINADSFDWHVMGLKILGVTPEYAEHGKELGMEVIEL